jgi:homeobox protein ESX1
MWGMSNTNNGGSPPTLGALRGQIPLPPDEPTGPQPGRPVPDPIPGPTQPPPDIEPPLPGETIPPAGDPPSEEPMRMKALPKEVGGPSGPEPTRYGDWERKGRVTDF